MQVGIHFSHCSHEFHRFICSVFLFFEFLIIRSVVCLLFYDMALMVSADRESTSHVNIYFDCFVFALIDKLCYMMTHHSDFILFLVSNRCRRVLLKQASVAINKQSYGIR